MIHTPFVPVDKAKFRLVDLPFVISFSFFHEGTVFGERPKCFPSASLTHAGSTLRSAPWSDLVFPHLVTHLRRLTHFDLDE